MLPKPLALAWLSTLLVISLGVLGWSLFPENASRWAIVVVSLPALWAFLEVAQSGGSSAEREAIMDWHRSVTAWVGLVMAVVIGFQLAIATELLGAEWDPIARRLRGVMFGLGLAIWGNYLPRVLSPWRFEDQPFDWQRVHRFAGWLATLCGIVLALVWLALPVESARAASIVITMAFCVVVIGRKFVSIANYSRG